ncbi:MAG: cytochrome P450 [Actinomycetales bacterium]|nr:cytochrome P450 [Actinomycetales bacterium]
MEFDPFDPATHANPDAAFARLRAECPVHHNTDRDFYTVASSPDIAAILRDAGNWSSRFRNGLEYHDAPSPMLLDADPPTHTWQRRLLQKAWTPRLIDLLEPRVREIVSAQMALVGDARTCDFVEVIAGPVPTMVISEFIGVPAEDRDDFRAWSDARVAATAGMPGHEEAYQAATRSIDAYFAEHIARRRRAIATGTAPEDFTTMILTTDDAGRLLTDPEVAQVLSLMLLGGIETTTMHLTNLAHRVATEPGIAEELRDRPDLVPLAVEESMRIDAPTLGLFRTPNTDTSVCGVDIPRDAKTMLLFAAVNRDPGIWDDPDTFRLDRPSHQMHRHFGFGHGPHRCLGAPLARLEGGVALDLMVRRWPGLHYVETPTLSDTMIFRGYTRQLLAWN